MFIDKVYIKKKIIDSMAKTIKEFLKLEKEDRNLHKNYYLDDVLEKNPNLFCPECDSDNLLLIHSHNVDGLDYRCNG